MSESPHRSNLRLIRTRCGAELLPLQVTKAEAARLMSVSTRTIERWVAQDLLPQIGSGRLARYAYSDLLALQERLRTGGHHGA